MTRFSTIQASLRAGGVPGWLVYDFRGTNPVFAQMLGEQMLSTRRAFLLITPDDEPRLLISRVDATSGTEERLPGIAIDRYVRWTELDDWLRERVAPLGTVAMEYSPNGELPTMSWVDGGTLDLVRAHGVEVVSSAEVFQSSAAAWTESAFESHRRAMTHTVEIKDLAFAYAQDRVRAGERVTEFEVQAFIVSEFERRGLVTDDPPVVAVNEHSGDPHYVPSEGASADISAGDWLLVDLWCRERQADAVFADITWVGVLADAVPDEHQKVFDVVAAGRDAVIARLEAAGPEPLRGFELDRVAREVIAASGYGDYFVHRTGHSLSPGPAVHGLGANLDDLETHDIRPIGPGLGFTIEPGVYLPAFGVRSEVNVYMRADGPLVTAPIQRAPLVLPVT
jgi:Xaa-Pro aminopeptidase